jgi:diguanylate cyclase (GGDEF)-like protein
MDPTVAIPEKGADREAFPPSEAVRIPGQSSISTVQGRNRPITGNVAKSSQQTGGWRRVFGRNDGDPGRLIDPELIALRADVDRLAAKAESLAEENDGLLREAEDLRLETQKLLQAILIDPQSGLPNAAAFDADHSQLDARRRRYEDTYAVLIADIDHFHTYNELFGEDAGHELTKLIATTIGQSVRQSDRTYRIGGEEFAVLLPGAELREAVTAAERVRETVESLQMLHPGNPLGVVTLTIAAIGAGFRHKAPKEMVSELQDLMVAGKRAGRNRVVWPH